jgi:hypothetical protein
MESKLKKRVVEQCLALDVNDLIRAGALKARSGTPCNVVWSDDGGKEIFRINFSPEGGPAVPFLRVSYRPSLSRSEPICYGISLATVACQFGGRKFLFCCPGAVEGAPCGRPVRKLYLVEGSWVCRQCGDLTYVARQQHDKRKDALIRDPIKLALALESDNPKEQILAIGAFAQAVARLGKRARSARARMMIGPKFGRGKGRQGQATVTSDIPSFETLADRLCGSRT